MSSQTELVDVPLQPPEDLVCRMTEEWRRLGWEGRWEGRGRSARSACWKICSISTILFPETAHSQSNLKLGTCFLDFQLSGIVASISSSIPLIHLKLRCNFCTLALPHFHIFVVVWAQRPCGPYVPVDNCVGCSLSPGSEPCTLFFFLFCRTP